MNFKDKVIVITGASSGIGEASAEEFAKRGANIVLVARRKDKLEQVEKNLAKFSVKILSLVCDVSEKEQVKQMVEKVLETFPHIDVLINNAGFVIYGKVEELSIEDVESQMKTNYFGTIYCTKLFLPHFLKQNSGHIVNVASVGGSFGVPGIATYCATKFALLGFSEGLHHELHETNVGVTVVSPIMVRTNLFDHPSFKNFTKHATGISLSAETVAKAVLKAADSPRLEIVVPSVVRIGIWFKQTFPFIINPIIGNVFRKQLDKRDS